MAAYLTYPPFRLWALVVAGRSPVCPMARAVECKANMDEKIRIKDRMLAGSHLLKEDSGLELWSTPKGQFWIPKGNRYVLPFNLAEMEQHIYGTGEHFIHAGDVVLDCGASDGDFTRQALEAGAQTVVALERRMHPAQSGSGGGGRPCDRIPEGRVGQGRQPHAECG